YVDVPESREELAKGDALVPEHVRKARLQGQKTYRLPPLQIRQPRHYAIQLPVGKEVRRAKGVLGALRQALTRLHAREASPDTKVLRQVSSEMTASVVRNPDAMIWLTRVRERNDHAFRHAVNTAVWALVFGRHLGLETEVLENLCVSALLAQVGKLELSVDLLRPESELSDDEFAQYKQYVERGAGLLEGQYSPQVVNTVRFHRERHNGTGFPQGVLGDRIPLSARILGLVDHYETLIEPRASGTPMTPAQAVASLYDARDLSFQGDLVERFIQAVGVYPTGSWVRLSDGRIGVVVTHAAERRLWPTVMVVADAQGNALRKGELLDIADHNARCAPADAVQVTECLPAGTEPVDVSQYALAGESGWLGGWKSALRA
ncbi:MAG: HD-GYP domain-containing protein, partial [Gammaproteobacteria bacterium]|nr:HD-GYP domain-containing protein [Gammaproteobacteria bacterium]